jgi:hypothetical protein
MREQRRLARLRHYDDEDVTLSAEEDVLGLPVRAKLPHRSTCGPT